MKPDDKNISGLREELREILQENINVYDDSTEWGGCYEPLLTLIEAQRRKAVEEAFDRIDVADSQIIPILKQKGRILSEMFPNSHAE